MHLSQPIGAGAFEGQHGMSLAIPSVMSVAEILSVIACVETSGDACAMTGRETGANARPAITGITSSQRIVKLRFTDVDSHPHAAKVSLSLTWKGYLVTIEPDQITHACLCAG